LWGGRDKAFSRVGFLLRPNPAPTTELNFSECEQQLLACKTAQIKMADREGGLVQQCHEIRRQDEVATDLATDTLDRAPGRGVAAVGKPPAGAIAESLA
jgi:hypothetical protein